MPVPSPRNLEQRVALLERSKQIGMLFDGGGNVLATGAYEGHPWIPFNGTIVQAILTAQQVGSIVIDIWKTPFGSYPPVLANSIVASAPPTLSSTDHMSTIALTGWTTAVNIGDSIWYNINSCSLITRATLALIVQT